MDPRSALIGFGSRPEDPYVRIMWATARGKGCTLSWQECRDMHLDDAIATRATNVVEGRGDGLITGPRVCGPRYETCDD